jgi:hypothetical protein
VYKDLTLPTVTSEESLCPFKSRNSSPFADEKKEVMGSTTRTLQGVISSIPLSEEHCWSSRRKNSKPQLQGHKELKP